MPELRQPISKYLKHANRDRVSTFLLYRVISIFSLRVQTVLRGVVALCYQQGATTPRCTV